MPNTTPIGFAYADMELNGTNLVNVPTTGADKGIGIGAGVAAETSLEIGGTYPTSGGNTNVTRSIGTIPSGTTTAARIYDSSPSTEAASFTLTTLQHYRAQQGTFGAGSAVTTQVGFTANSTLTGATNNYGFQGSIAAGSNRFNCYMSGSADNYFAGSVGVGQVPAADQKLRIAGTYPSSGNVSFIAIADGTIPSTATSAAITFSSSVSTQAASFTCASLQHYRVAQGTIGAGSSVTNQYGFLVQSGMTGATNNYAFYSDLAAAANRWNFYAAGTADNYFAGNVVIGGTAEAFAKVGVTGTLPSSAGTSVAYRVNATIPSGTTADYAGYSHFVATQATAFTIPNFYGFTAGGASLGAGSVVTNNYGFWVGSGNTFATNNYGFYSNIASGSNRWNFYANGTAANYFAGAVGIGTAPLTTLHVFTASTTEGVRIQRFAGNYYSELRQTDAQEGLAFLVGDGSTVAERLRIKGTGQTRFQPRAGNPGGAEAGDVYYDSNDNKLKVYNGTSWVDLH